MFLPVSLILRIIAIAAILVPVLMALVEKVIYPAADPMLVHALSALISLGA